MAGKEQTGFSVMRGAGGSGSDVGFDDTITGINDLNITMHDSMDTKYFMGDTCP